MTSDAVNPNARGSGRRELLSLIARWAVGGLYVTMGMGKALEPVGFLKLIRQYEMVDGPPFLNLIAATLPWFEVFCGLLLLGGVAVRGAALVSLAMLIPFTVVVWQRALVLQAAGGLPFCAVRFDCGCGAGEVAICAKLTENTVLILLSLWLALVGSRRWCLRPALWPSRLDLDFSGPAATERRGGDRP